MKPVMIVDDDPDIRGAVLETLEDEGYVALGARNGQEALALLRSLPVQPGLILLDMMMPVMDGQTFRAEQLADRAISEIPVVVMTADGSVGKKAAKLQAAALLKKPVELEGLLDVVRRFCA